MTHVLALLCTRGGCRHFSEVHPRRGVNSILRIRAMEIAVVTDAVDDAVDQTEVRTEECVSFNADPHCGPDRQS